MARIGLRQREAEHGHDAPKPDEIRHQLLTILASPAFHGSKRCQQFLEYVCEKSLSGEASSLKERTVAVEVFGRRPQADLGEDTIVRVGAREVRKRLAQFYVTPEGAASTVLVDLPPGSYAPDFRYPSAKKEEERLLPPPAVLIPAPKRKIGFAAGGLLLLAALAVVAMLKWQSASPAEAAFRRFWDPVFHAPEPLLLAVGHPIVYHPSTRARTLSEQRLPPLQAPVQRVLQLRPDEIDGSDMVPVFNQYVGVGDMVAATEVAGMLARRSKGIRVRLASSLEFADLRQAQTLLIGAITNRWTMEFEQAWRFQFRRIPEHGLAIVDTVDTTRRWDVASTDNGTAPEDYILVCRIRNSSAGGLQIVAAGVKQFGTEAAGRFLTDQNQLGAILTKLPAEWESKNLQIVLHARVIGNTPTQPELVAWHVW